MFFAPKSPKPVARGKRTKAFPALAHKQKEIRETEEKLHKQKAQLQRFLHDAPTLREKRTQRQREQFAPVPSSSRTALRGNFPNAEVLADPNFGSRPLRRERHKGLSLFLFLLVVLAVVAVWIVRLVL